MSEFHNTTLLNKTVTFQTQRDHLLELIQLSGSTSDDVSPHSTKYSPQLQRDSLTNGDKKPGAVHVFKIKNWQHVDIIKKIFRIKI